MGEDLKSDVGFVIRSMIRYHMKYGYLLQMEFSQYEHYVSDVIYGLCILFQNLNCYKNSI